MRRSKPIGQPLERFLTGVRLGLPDRDAAARAGWRPNTPYDWRREAELAYARGGKLTERERMLTEFADAWAKADAEFVTANLAVITRAAQNGTWTAAAWTLERRRPNDFSRRVEVTGPDGGPIAVEERLAAVLDAAQKVRHKSNGHGKVDTLTE